MIAIVDYGMGNLRSVQKGFERVGHTAAVTDDAQVLSESEKLVLPGVGAIADAMAGLRERGLIEPVIAFAASGRPVLGICLGLQLMFERSEEGGEHEGLGVLKGKVVRFADDLDCKVPHMGWNQIRIRRPAPILNGIEDGSYVYFVHSYYAVPAQAGLVAADTCYPTPFASVVWQDNIFATQFHPEKSQQVGLQLLRNFATL